MFLEHKNDNLTDVKKPGQSQIVLNVLNYNMQMRFLQFMKDGGTRTFACHPVGGKSTKVALVKQGASLQEN